MCSWVGRDAARDPRGDALAWLHLSGGIEANFDSANSTERYSPGVEYSLQLPQPLVARLGGGGGPAYTRSSERER